MSGCDRFTQGSVDRTKVSGCDRFTQGSVDRTVKCLVVTGLLRVQ